ncbi:YkgJ family cysteine cluster protein [Aquabacterium sp.]|uniref:YkgJ family cysteine cluster protein n=1 Tax=Aquabacterium sp. TaxID=1872578 RepID=UPI003D6D3C28
MSEERMLEHARPEFAKASEDLQKLGTREAVVNFYARHEARLGTAMAASTQTVACEAGCSFCCRQFEVVAQPVEVLEIHAHVSRHFKPDQLRGVIQRATQNVAARKAATEQERLTLRPTCPFLVDHSCSIYAVRPSVCRNYHATDKDNCQKSFDDPFSTWPTSYVEELFDTAMGSSAGFKNAVTALGLDTRDYHLSAAFLEAMRDPACAKRFKSGKKAFLKATAPGFNG